MGVGLAVTLQRWFLVDAGVSTMGLVPGGPQITELEFGVGARF